MATRDEMLGCVDREIKMRERDRGDRARVRLLLGWFPSAGLPSPKASPTVADCPECDQPMLPAGEAKRPNEYDHASGCPRGLLERDRDGLLELAKFLLRDTCDDDTCACCTDVRSSVKHALSRLSTPAYRWDSRAGIYVPTEARSKEEKTR
jgi:hypothetical protein